jgi:hypothetical protein
VAAEDVGWKIKSLIDGMRWQGLLLKSMMGKVEKTSQEVDKVVKVEKVTCGSMKRPRTDYAPNRTSQSCRLLSSELLSSLLHRHCIGRTSIPSAISQDSYGWFPPTTAPVYH